jgi:hypothetical protein
MLPNLQRLSIRGCNYSIIIHYEKVKKGLFRFGWDMNTALNFIQMRFPNFSPRNSLI